MSEFRDAIAATAEASTDNYFAVVDAADKAGTTTQELLDSPYLLEADAVLAMPEMQAIRKALGDLTDRLAPEYGLDWRDTMFHFRLPESVIAWVLDEGSNP